MICDSRGTHGGSLDNLAKEELYDATCRRLRGGRKSSTSSSGASSSYGCNQVRVSARQREGGKILIHFFKVAFFFKVEEN